MSTKNKVIYSGILAILGLIAFMPVFAQSQGQDRASNITAAIGDNTASPAPRVIPPGFYQLNNLEITKEAQTSVLPATIEAVQKADASCAILGGGKTDKSLPCPASKDKGSQTYTIQIDNKTSILGIDREPASLNDLNKGDQINVLGFISSSDPFLISASVVRDLADKNYHRSFSGTVKDVTVDGFTLVSDDGTEITVKNPIVEGAKITIQGVFDKTNNLLDNILSIFIKPSVSETQEQIKPAETQPQTSVPSSAKEPSRLFKNFLKVFGF